MPDALRSVVRSVPARVKVNTESGAGHSRIGPRWRDFKGTINKGLVCRNAQHARARKVDTRSVRAGRVEHRRFHLD